MLQTIRDKFTGWIAIVFIGLLALTLVISFGNMEQTPLQDNVVITVNGEEITLFEFQEEFSNKLAEFQDLLGDEVPEVLEQTIKESAGEDLIIRVLLLDYLSNNGYRVSPEYVAELIRTNESFQLGGVFIRENYEAILASQGVSVDQFENDLRLQLEINQLRRGLIETAFMTNAEFTQFIELQMQERSGQMLIIDSSRFKDQVNVDPSEVNDYYENNIDLFQSNEELDVEYLEINIEDVAQQVQFSGDEIRDYYENNLDRFVSNEERKSSHILVAIDEDTTDEQAAELIKEIQTKLETETFEELAKQYSDDPGSAAQGGDLGWAETGLFVPEFESALFSMNVGDTSEAVKTDFGYHLIRMDDIKPGQQQAFEDIEYELELEYSRLLAEEELFELADQMADLTLQSYNELSTVAEKMSLKKSNLDAFTRTGSTFLHQDPEMVNILFSPGSIELGENTPLFQIGDSVIVARAKAHRLPSTRDFVEVQGDIQSFIMNQEAMKLANDYADGLKNDESLVFGDLSQDDGIQVEDFQILRNSTNYSRGLSDAIFSLKKDLINEEIVVFSELEKVYLAKVSSVDTGNLSLFSDQERSDAKSDLSEQYGSQDLDGLAQSLRDNAEVFIEPGLYEGLFDL
ncbi:SurA N-terminal domain-containing protein [Gammaproteobacteria bacterium]|nr:SurA N-terminal domain-containing protein [Gammaproteobacteria bacterium]|tara:strand:+ start:1283 stop:3175 length:1893 start_codon:yes stop_codon:yes gene_type:complete